VAVELRYVEYIVFAVGIVAVVSINEAVDCAFDAEEVTAKSATSADSDK